MVPTVGAQSIMTSLSVKARKDSKSKYFSWNKNGIRLREMKKLQISLYVAWRWLHSNIVKRKRRVERRYLFTHQWRIEAFRDDVHICQCVFNYSEWGLLPLMNNTHPTEWLHSLIWDLATLLLLLAFTLKQGL